MSTFRLPALVLALGLLGFAASAGVVFTASNVVPPSSAGTKSQGQDINDIKPDTCTATLTTLVTGSGNFNGTAGADLILGDSGVNVIAAGAGADCILGGGDSDVLTGDGGDDVLYGGPGAGDICTGSGQADAFPGGDCETILP